MQQHKTQKALALQKARQEIEKRFPRKNISMEKREIIRLAKRKYNNFWEN